MPSGSDTPHLRPAQLPRLPEVMISLHLNPHFCAGAQGGFQAQRHFGADTGAAIQERGQRLA